MSTKTGSECSDGTIQVQDYVPFSLQIRDLTIITRKSIDDHYPPSRLAQAI